MSRYDRPQDGHYRDYIDSSPIPRRDRYRGQELVASYTPQPIHPSLPSGTNASYDGPGGRMIIERPRSRDLDRDRTLWAWDSDRERERFRMTCRERENLKQRLSSPQVVTTTTQPQYRARSLSLSRSGSFSSLTDSDSETPQRTRRDGYQPPGRHVPSHRRLYHVRDNHDRDSDIRPYHSNSLPPSQRRPTIKYYQPTMPVRDLKDRFIDRDSDREPSYRPIQPERQLHHSSSDPMNDLRLGMQRIGKVLSHEPGHSPRLGGSMAPRSVSIDGKIATVDSGVVVRRPSSGYGVRDVPIPYRRPVKPQYNQVHVLILTWSFHDLKQPAYDAPQVGDVTSLEEETRRVRETFESYGYKVRDFSIPMHRSAEHLRAKLNQFCRLADDDTLLIVYYHGHGCLNSDAELVFSSHEHPSDESWSRHAATDLYAALINGDSCPAHGHSYQYHELLKKYERYRSISEVPWSEIRPILLNAPSDLFLILDCCAAGGANLGNWNWQFSQAHNSSRPPSPFHPPPLGPGRLHPYTKHLFAACGFESVTHDDMTAAMCEVLDEWVPGGNAHGKVLTPAPSSPFLTTKRLHQIMEEKLQKNGSQPIFKQLLPADPEQYITLPNLLYRRLIPGDGNRGGWMNPGKGRSDWDDRSDRGRELGWR